MKQKIAAAISLIAHPLITISIFILVVMFSYEEFNKALLISLYQIKIGKEDKYGKLHKQRIERST